MDHFFSCEYFSPFELFIVGYEETCAKRNSRNSLRIQIIRTNFLSNSSFHFFLFLSLTHFFYKAKRISTKFSHLPEGSSRENARAKYVPNLPPCADSPAAIGINICKQQMNSIKIEYEFKLFNVDLRDIPLQSQQPT